MTFVFLLKVSQDKYQNAKHDTNTFRYSDANQVHTLFVTNFIESLFRMIFRTMTIRGEWYDYKDNIKNIF